MLRRICSGVSVATFAMGNQLLHGAKRWKYNSKVVEHFKNPRNVGELDKSNEDVGSAVRGAPECGDVLQIQIKVNPETGVIEDSKFKAFGCGSAIASSSFASELIRGKTIADAMKLTNKDIAAELSLPPVKLHCSMLAEETVRGAINDYLSKKPQMKTKVRRVKVNEEQTSDAPEQ